MVYYVFNYAPKRDEMWSARMILLVNDEDQFMIYHTDQFAIIDKMVDDILKKLRGFVFVNEDRNLVSSSEEALLTRHDFLDEGATEMVYNLARDLTPAGGCLFGSSESLVSEPPRGNDEPFDWGYCFISFVLCNHDLRSRRETLPYLLQTADYLFRPLVSWPPFEPFLGMADTLIAALKVRMQPHLQQQRIVLTMYNGSNEPYAPGFYENQGALTNIIVAMADYCDVTFIRTAEDGEIIKNIASMRKYEMIEFNASVAHMVKYRNMSKFVKPFLHLMISIYDSDYDGNFLYKFVAGPSDYDDTVKHYVNIFYERNNCNRTLNFRKFKLLKMLKKWCPVPPTECPPWNSID